MDREIENIKDNRISFQEYKKSVLQVLPIFVVSVILIIFPIFSILPSGIFVLYLLYYTNLRISHAVINKLLIIPFVIIYNFYILFVTEIYILYIILALILYISFIILLAKYLPNYIGERKYLFNNEKYRHIADFCDISKPMYNILFFKFNSFINRKEYFSIIIFLILVNVFIYYDIRLLYVVRDYLYYQLDFTFFRPDDFFAIMVILIYFIMLLYIQFIIFFTRLTSIFGTAKYNILVIVFLGVLEYFFTKYIAVEFSLASYIAYFLIAGLFPPKKEYVSSKIGK